MASYTFSNAVIVETGGTGADIVWDRVAITVHDGDADTQLNRDSADPGADQAFVITAFNEVKAGSPFEPEIGFTYDSIDRANRGTATLRDAAGATIQGFWFEIDNGDRDFRVFIPTQPNAGFDYTQNGNGVLQNVATRDWSYGEVGAAGGDQFVISEPADATAHNWNLDEGDDLAQSGAGNDTISLGTGNDTAFAGGGSDTVQGGEGADSLLGEAGNDSLVGGADGDTLRGGEGQDTLRGNAGADSLEGGAGNDSLDAGSEDQSADTLAGGAGNDTLDSFGGDDSLDGGTGADSILGGEGADSAVGGDGNDTILGGTGDDTLVGDGGTLEPLLTRQSFNWREIPDPNGGNPIDDNDLLNGGTVQNTGLVTVTATFTPISNNAELRFEGTDTQVVSGIDGGAETVSGTSAGLLRGFAQGDTSLLRFDFASAAAGVSGEVRNVQFRINDLDENDFRDRLTIRAFDAAGNPVDIRLAAGADISLTDSDGLGGADSAEARDGVDQTNPADPAGSLLVSVAGPAARIEILYQNLDSGTQAVQITDIFFDAVTPSTATPTGNDSVLGGVGDDLIDGGSGNDTLIGQEDDDTILGAEGADSIEGSQGNDSVEGGAGNDTITDFDGSNTLSGGEGADSITATGGGGSFDSILGGVGNDTIGVFKGDGSQTFVDGGADDDRITVFNGANSTNTIEGGTGNDSIQAGDARDTISGGDGNDTIDAGAGADMVDGGAGNDSLQGAAGSDTVLGGLGDDTIRDFDGSNSVEGGDGADDISVTGGDGVANTILGGAGGDLIVQFSGAGSTAFIDGGDDGDDITSGDSADTILGGAGGDVISAGGGLDALTGGLGDDVIAGGTGSDTIFLANGDGSDVIVGGEDGDGSDIDRIILSGGNLRVTFTNDDRATESGIIEFFGADGNLLSTTSFSEIEQVICFAAGTRLRTPEGERAVETLAAGDLVETLDRGAQPVRWVGRRLVPARGRFAPVRIRAGAFGAARDLLVSPQHRMLLRGPEAELLFGAPEALAAARHLVDGDRVRIDETMDVVEYVHVLFDRHEIVFAEGAPTESFHPGAAALAGVTDGAREELFALFPELRGRAEGLGPLARPVLRAHEARALARRAA